MIDRKRLLDDLRKLVTKLEKDLRERCEENADVDARVRREYEQAKEAKRTAQLYKIWRDEWITQVAVAWVLGVVFVRFIEDNELIATPFIAGPSDRLDFAKEQRTAFFTRNPTLSDREYLEHVFREVAKLPAMKELYDERHNPLWALGVSGDGAKLILEQFQKTEPTGALVHDFTDPAWETRFLGDLYQDLSESARKKYALLQTPEFVEEFILDRTLDPAIAEFGLEKVRMIDPTCGSGHFLLGAFARIFRLWTEREPGTNSSVLTQRALDSIHGVDLNPYAVAVSRFRLVVAALKSSTMSRLGDAPEFCVHLAVGDSLLHGAPGTGGAAQAGWQFAPGAHIYQLEDGHAIQRVLRSGFYHAVVGNPPYIQVKDRALNEAYRSRFTTCFRKYSLVAPFLERFFDLAAPSGFVGAITANSFMTREYGRRLINEFLPSVDLTHVIDTSKAVIPGHGTPTVILLGRHRGATSDTLRVLRGIRGQTSAVRDAALGEVWTSILNGIDRASYQDDLVTVSDVSREVFSSHPWVMGGGGAAELKQRIDDSSERRLRDLVTSIGFAAIFGEDDAYLRPNDHWAVRLNTSRPLVDGEEIRDWTMTWSKSVLFPYDEDLQLHVSNAMARLLWRSRTVLWNRADFGNVTYRAAGRSYAEYHQMPIDKQATRYSIAFADIATHNHFVFDDGGKLFNRHAPLIKLHDADNEGAHKELVALLNSSTICFWLKQVCFPKTSALTDVSTVRGRPEAVGYEFTAARLMDCPIPDELSLEKVRSIGRQLHTIAARLGENRPGAVIQRAKMTGARLSDLLASAEVETDNLTSRLVALQEELDWESYRAFGLWERGSDDAILGGDVGVRPSLRPFEWSCAQAPAELSPIAATVYEERRRLLANNADLQLIESSVYKRPWLGRQGVYGRYTGMPYLERARHEAASELVRMAEEFALAQNPAVSSISQIAEQMRRSSLGEQLAVFWSASSEPDWQSVLRELLGSWCIPLLPSLVYRESGMQKREAWESTWSSQRAEDGGELVGDIPVPPKYKKVDFRSAVYWSLRGKLDVPKERFISFPGCERESDSSLPILWAGYDHLQQAKAIAAYYQDLKEHEGAGPAKLGKLLACILELLPWLKQWHNDVDPEYGTRMGDFFETFMLSEMSSLGLSMDDVRKIRGL